MRIFVLFFFIDLNEQTTIFAIAKNIAHITKSVGCSFFMFFFSWWTFRLYSMYFQMPCTSAVLLVPVRAFVPFYFISVGWVLIENSTTVLFLKMDSFSWILIKNPPTASSKICFQYKMDKIQLLFIIRLVDECIDVSSGYSIFITYPSQRKIRTIQRLCRCIRIDKLNKLYYLS